jgi:hypothetical protein
LKNYQRKSALRFWLRTVLWIFLRRRPIPKNTEHPTEDVAVADPDKDNLELDESIALFTSLVRDSFSSLT